MLHVAGRGGTRIGEAAPGQMSEMGPTGRLVKQEETKVTKTDDPPLVALLAYKRISGTFYKSRIKDLLYNGLLSALST